MKNLKWLACIAVAAALLAGCSKTEVAPNIGEDDTMVFSADFLGNYTYAGPNAERCGSFPYIQIVVDGEGTGPQLENFTVHIDFCYDVVTGYYSDTRAFMTAANGDILFVSCEGQVFDGRLEDHPEYVTSFFRDPFVILGGTGRYEGASGSGMTNDYNSSKDDYSHHHWEGTITLPKMNN
jgi:hypothetical protein